MPYYDPLLLFSKKYRQQYEYWINQLANLDYSSLCSVGQAEPAESASIHEYESIQFQLNRETDQNVMSICKGNNLAIYIYLLSGLKCLLYRMTGENDLCVTSPLLYSQGNQVSLNPYVIARSQVIWRTNASRRNTKRKRNGCRCISKPRLPLGESVGGYWPYVCRRAIR
jgi:hypothetical protein